MRGCSKLPNGVSPRESVWFAITSFTLNADENAFAHTPNANTPKIIMTDVWSLTSCLTIRWVIDCSIGFLLHELDDTQKNRCPKKGV